MSGKWENIVTMTDWFDCPRGGVAYFEGTPHFYESTWDKTNDDYGSDYYLSPLDDKWLPLIVEDWKTWLRWAEAFDAGQTTSETHPALPEDTERHRELEALLTPVLQTMPNARRMYAEFHHPDTKSPAPGWDGWQVRWSVQPPHPST